MKRTTGAFNRHGPRTLVVAKFIPGMSTVAPPLAIGTVALADGSSALGFVCEGYAGAALPDIAHHGGWRHYRAALVDLDRSS